MTMWFLLLARHQLLTNWLDETRVRSMEGAGQGCKGKVGVARVEWVWPGAAYFVQPLRVGKQVLTGHI